MRMTNNYYRGEIYNFVLADNRRDAAKLLNCDIVHVKFHKRVPRPALQRAGDHAAKLPVHMWRKKWWGHR